VLNKADLAGFAAGGPIAVADRRAAEYQALTGVPTVPTVGLLAAATLDDELIAALRLLTAEPADLTSTDGFCRPTTGCPAPCARRRWTLWTSSASPTASSRCGGALRPPLPAVLRRLSQVDRVMAQLAATGAGCATGGCTAPSGCALATRQAGASSSSR
jgi:hypothetical protein